MTYATSSRGGIRSKRGFTNPQGGENTFDEGIAMVTSLRKKWRPGEAQCITRERTVFNARLEAQSNEEAEEEKMKGGGEMFSRAASLLTSRAAASHQRKSKND